MLGWAKQLLGQNDHPLMDGRRARRWLTELPQNDALKALAELTQGLQALGDLNQRLPDRLDVLFMLDEASIGHRNRVAREYLSQARLPTYRENALWFGLQQFWSALAQAYVGTLDRAQAAGGTIAPDRLLLFVLRGLYAGRHQIKWRLLRYMVVDGAQWRAMGRFFVVAENNRIGSSASRVYEGAATQSTPRDELLKVLLLAMSATDSLLPIQTEIASRLIDAVVGRCDWSDQQTAQLGFCFNLLGEQGPLRVVGAPAQVGVWRFFGGQNVLDPLAQFQRDAEHGVLSTGVHLGGDYPVHQVAIAAEHLQRYWAHPAPERRAERIASYQRIEVVHGFASVLRHFIQQDMPLSQAQSQDDDIGEIIEVNAIDAGPAGAERDDPLYTADVGSVSSLESWVVQNVSATGLGAVIPRVTGDWLQVGQLLALAFLEPRSCWKLAVIRRLHQNTQGQMCVGLEVLAQQVAAARLGLAGMVLQEEEFALVLDGATGNELKVLTRVGTLGPSTVAHIEYQGRFSVRARCCLEKNGSFDLTLVTKISEDALEKPC